jgi:predicted nucleic acid-binding protein
MIADTIVDTNILVYMYDIAASPGKRAKALDVVKALVANKQAVLPAQVLGEFFVSVTQRIASPLSPDEALVRIDHYLRCVKVVPITAVVAREAARGVIEHQLSYWDAQIWAVARLNQISLIITEDMPEQEYIEGVRYSNPFC